MGGPYPRLFLWNQTKYVEAVCGVWKTLKRTLENGESDGIRRRFGCFHVRQPYSARTPDNGPGRFAGSPNIFGMILDELSAKICPRLNVFGPNLASACQSSPGEPLALLSGVLFSNSWV